MPAEVIDDGYADFARRRNPIMDVFDGEGVRFTLEVHPSEIAYDYWTTARALEAVDHRAAFGLNWDPSHMLDRLPGPGLHIEWGDPGMSRLEGAPRALAHVRSLLWDPPTAAFDSVFTQKD